MPSVFQPIQYLINAMGFLTTFPLLLQLLRVIFIYFLVYWGCILFRIFAWLHKRCGWFLYHFQIKGWFICFLIQKHVAGLSDQLACNQGTPISIPRRDHFPTLFPIWHDDLSPFSDASLSLCTIAVEESLNEISKTVVWIAVPVWNRFLRKEPNSVIINISV